MSTEKAFIGEWDYARFQFKIYFQWIISTVVGPGVVVPGLSALQFTPPSQGAFFLVTVTGPWVDFF